MSSYNKRKGKEFEKKVAKIIHEFLLKTYNEYKTLIENIDSSVGVKRDADSGISITSKGDIDLGVGVKFFPFSIECKKRNDLDISLKNIFKLDKSKLKSIYEKQAKKKAEQHDLYPLLVFSKNYSDIYCFFNIEDYDWFDIELLKNVDYLKSGNFIIMKFNDFLTEVSKHGVVTRNNTRKIKI